MQKPGERFSRFVLRFFCVCRAEKKNSRPGRYSYAQAGVFAALRYFVSMD